MNTRLVKSKSSRKKPVIAPAEVAPPPPQSLFTPLNFAVPLPANAPFRRIIE